MNVNRSYLFALITALAMTPSTASVRAADTANRIQRCETGDGERIYTDTACRQFDAKAVPMSGDLVTRIQYEDRLSVPPMDASGQPIDARPQRPVSGRRSLADGCARSTTQLSMDLTGAFALGDVNRIAESYHWAGMTHRSGQHIMDGLQQLAKRSLRDVQYFNATIGYAYALQVADTGHAPSNADVGVMQLLFDGDGAPSIVDFDVKRYSGCYFVQF